MEPFQTFKGLVCPMDRTNVDTDQIIPKQFLKRVERKGFGECLFFNWRFNEKGAKNPDFVLNQPKYAGASILVAGDNFGCGSSREHAPWALQDYGFKVIIAPSFADIFYNNCQKNGILAIRLDKEKTDVLIAYATKTSLHLTINLEDQTITGDGFSYTFDIDPYQKEMLLEGLDEIAVTMRHEDEIAAYEQKHTVSA
ncbi:3-isopropylmalate dehydratase small subunit [Sporolactobacillus putidus]|uniref:3-isopropylmalate dehydratase small subunit n=1 Tax=Sporolactobacillus putidus TaxID=492735 RepID=A0A917W183_9BACL|nr:3-isopropylmalate dehydratase small subunit [Sporolactobacillus putidus]GGL50090.1 3-isopropylmalate dehydratase small subunit [Sporolactobacillus putidus]